MNMADVISNGDNGVWKMDADAFIPTPEGHVKIKNVEYPIFNFLDIEIADSLAVARIGEEIRNAKTYDLRLERSIEQVMMLNKPGTPRLTKEIFAGLTPHQIITLTMLASSVAQIPLKADPEKKEGESSVEAESPSTLPESAASTDGTPTGSSV
jgi:hypothetical protein